MLDGKPQFGLESMLSMTYLGGAGGVRQGLGLRVGPGLGLQPGPGLDVAFWLGLGRGRGRGCCRGCWGLEWGTG